MSLARFYGGRLKNARLARCLTASSLAEQIGVSPGAISQYEKGVTEPRARVLDQICTQLSLPEVHFLAPEPKDDPAPRLYRSRASAIKRARDSAEKRQQWFSEMYDTISEEVEFPQITLPSFDFPQDPVGIGAAEIERTASSVRDALGVGDGPVESMVSLLENYGSRTARFAFGAETLNAFSQYGSSVSVTLNADETTAARGRFDAAHELGHLLLHRNVPARLAANSAVHKKMEEQAHRFASAFLFPASAFADEVYSISINSLVDVKSRWRVSIGMMIRRAYDLKLITQTSYTRAYRELSRRGYRLSEPLDDELEPERPTLLRDAILLLVDEKVFSKEQLRSKLRLSNADIEILAQLPRGYLSDDWGRVVGLEPTRGPSNPSRGEGANVLQFPKKR